MDGKLHVANAEGTRTLAVIPHNAQELAERIERLSASTTQVQVIDRVGFQAAAETLRSVKALANQLEGMRTSVTGPLNAALSTVNDWFRDPKAKLARVEGLLKDALGKFEREERARVEEEQRQARLRADQEREELERRAASARAQGKDEKAADLSARAASVVPAQPETAPVKARGMGFGEKWTYTVTDEASIPREYLMVDHTKLGQVVRAMKDKTNIPGVVVQSGAQVSARGIR